MSWLVFITLGITIGCNILASLLSYLILYTSFLTKKRIQGQRYKTGIFCRRAPLITFNLVTLMILTYVGLSSFEELFVWETPVTSLGWIALLIQLIILIVIDDIYFYFYHRTLNK